MAHDALVRVRDIILAVHQGCAGLIEFRAFPSKARKFVAPDGIEAAARFCDERSHENLFFGVASRRAEGDGTLDGCRQLGALYADIDFKTTPEEDARRRLADCPCSPSIMVRSGGGLHCYWLLREPFDLPEEAEAVYLLLRRLAHHLGGDMTAAEPARVLRVPGTTNHKPEYSPSRRVTVELFEPDRRYNPSDFDEWLPDMPAAIASTSEPVSLAEPIRDGGRNDTLYKVGRRFKLKQLDDGTIASTLRLLNRDRCSPPLADHEVEAIISQVCTQPDRHDFDRQTTAAPRPPWPTPLSAAAYHGPLGELVGLIEPHTEADPAAVLVQLLVAFGNVVGRHVFCEAGSAAHYLNEFAVVVGDTASLEKGPPGRTCVG